MGGLFKVPSAPSVSNATAAVTPTATTVDTATAERERRLEALNRQRLGRAGTITTSDRGLLVPASWEPQRKTLLGE